jgi:hypothetical protein
MSDDLRRESQFHLRGPEVWFSDANESYLFILFHDVSFRKHTSSCSGQITTGAKVSDGSDFNFSMFESLVNVSFTDDPF